MLVCSICVACVSRPLTGRGATSLTFYPVPDDHRDVALAVLAGVPLRWLPPAAVEQVDARVSLDGIRRAVGAVDAETVRAVHQKLLCQRRLGR